ncbi:MAG: hypothetical protein V3T59_01125 [Desulfobacterales bacterium]
MNIYFHDTIVYTLAIALIVILLKAKSTKLKIAFCFCFFVLFFLNPFRFEIKNSKERLKFNNNFYEIPKKEEFIQQEFNERQEHEYEKLKQQSRESTNEN